MHLDHKDHKVNFRLRLFYADSALKHSLNQKAQTQAEPTDGSAQHIQHWADNERSYHVTGYQLGTVKYMLMFLPSHQSVFLQNKHAGRLVEGAGSEAAPIAAPGHRVHLGAVCREFSGLAVSTEMFLQRLSRHGEPHCTRH